MKKAIVLTIKFVLAITFFVTFSSASLVKNDFVGASRLVFVEYEEITFILESDDLNIEDSDPVIIAHQILSYGKSELGRDLICHSLAPQVYNKTILLNFAIHGFEDDYPHDGIVLTSTANALLNYYIDNNILEVTRLLIIPMANPDGLIDGTTNDSFGRCNASGIDLNRDFDARWRINLPGRNYTPSPFSAAESQALRDLVLSYKPGIVLDFHGWLNITIGDTKLAVVFQEEMGLAHRRDFSSGCNGYFAFWAHTQGALGLLVEFKDSEIDLHKLINAINRIIEN